MITPVLKLTISDYNNFSNPVKYAQAPGGTDDLLTQEIVLDTLLAAEEKVLNILNERQRRLMRFIDGEEVVRYATQGQTEFHTGLAPVTSVLGVWKNWPARTPFNVDDLGSSLPFSEFSINLSTGKVTLTTPLDAGENIIIAYRHTAGERMHALRDSALVFATNSLVLRLPSAEYELKEYWERAQAKAYGDLKSMATGQGGGLDVLDELILAKETRKPKSEGYFAPLGAW